jgi:Protein of unknown function (DUF4240)
MDIAYVEKYEKNFWKLIEKSKEENETAKEQIEELVATLCIKSEDELLAFEINLRKQLKALNTPTMVELCTILSTKFKVEKDRVRFEKKPGLNGFLYFRCWLILQGKEIVEIAQTNVEQLVDTDINIESVKAEGMLRVAQDAFSNDEEDETIIKAANKFDKKLNYDLVEFIPDEEVKYEDLDKKYPVLVKTVVELGD